MSEHTPEKWEVGPSHVIKHIYQNEHNQRCTAFIGEMLGGIDANPEANARRLVACVNACEGIPTEALEGGVIGELMDALQSMIDPIERGWMVTDWDLRMSTGKAAITKAKGE